MKTNKQTHVQTTVTLPTVRLPIHSTARLINFVLNSTLH